MKHSNQYRQLLDEIYLDEELMVLQEEVLNQCLRELRCKRHRHYCRYVFTGIAALLLTAIFLRFDIQDSPRHMEPLDDYVDIIRTSQLPEQRIVRTAKACETVFSTSHKDIVCCTVNESKVAIQNDYKVARLGDKELLNTFAGIPCGIIRPRGGGSKLVFFNPEDARRFGGNAVRTSF